MTLNDWARQWGIPREAISDLVRILHPAPTIELAAGMSEAAVTSRMRLEAARAGVLLWRNNVGALQDAGGRWVRYGLANDSKQMNERIKSADWIGIRPIVITPAMVGYTIGQFVSREVKHGGWRYSGKGREEPQMRWAQLIAARGGDAAIVSGEGSFLDASVS